MATENKREEKKLSQRSPTKVLTQLLRTNSLGKKYIEKGSLRIESRTEQQHWTRTEWKMTTQRKGKKETRRSPTKVCFCFCFCFNVNTVTKNRQLFIWGVSLTHPMLASFYVRNFLHTSHAKGVSLTHLVMASLGGSFFFHVPCWLVHVGSLSYTSCAGCLM